MKQQSPNAQVPDGGAEDPQRGLSMTSFIRRIFRRYPWLLVGTILVTVASGFLDAMGLALIIPMAEFLAGTDPSPTNPVLKQIKSTFEFVGIDYTLRWTVLVIIGVMSLRGCGLFARHWLTAKTAARYEYDEKMQAYTSVLNADWLFIASQRGSDVIAAIVTEGQRAGRLLASTAGFLASAFLVVFYIVLTLIVSWETTLVASIGLIAIVAIYRKLVIMARSLGTQRTLVNSELLQELSEGVASAKAIKSSGIEDRAVKRIEPIATRLARIDIRLGVNEGVLASTYDLAFIGFMAGGLLVSIRYLDILASSALLFALLSWRIFQQARMAQSSLQGASKNLSAAERLHELAVQASQHLESSGEKHFKHLERSIDFRDVSFGYKPGATIIHDISLLIPARSTVALVGASGTGKTTLIDMLVGLLPPRKGSILLDAVPIGNYDIRSWRANLGYVAQGGVLFHDTIRNNIAWGKPGATDSEIQGAAKKAHAHEFIDALRDGYSTVIGDRGSQLSGGQRQRVALARALIGNPTLLIMDEATSELDIDSERHIQKTLDSLHGTMTIVLVAHRLSTVMSSDLIYFLTDGTISEQGSPSELIAKKGDFYRLHQATFEQPNPGSANAND